MSVSREIRWKASHPYILNFPSEIIFDKVSHHNIKNLKVRQKYFAARRIHLSSYGLILRSSDLCLMYELKVRNFWDTSRTAFPMGLPKVHVSGKNPTSGNSWKELFTAPPEALACSINTPASYNLGQNCWENCMLGQHFSKHRSRTDSSLSPFPWKQCCCVFKRKPVPWAFVGSNIELGEGVFIPQRRRFGNSFVP